MGFIARKLNVSSGLLRFSNVLSCWLSNRNSYIGVDRHLRRSNQFRGLACRITYPKYLTIFSEIPVSSLACCDVIEMCMDVLLVLSTKSGRHERKYLSNHQLYER